MALTLEAVEFRSPIARFKKSDIFDRTSGEVQLIFDPVWQRRFAAIWKLFGGFIEGDSSSEVFQAAGDGPTFGAVAQQSQEQSLLGLLLPDSVSNSTMPTLLEIQRQLAMIQDSSRPTPEIPDLQVYNALMSREIPQALNTDSNPTFALLTVAGLTITGLTAKSFLYADASKGVVSTAAPTNGQLLIGSTGAIPALGTITGTANEIIVTLGAGTITLTTPQAIGTTSNVVFNNITSNGTLTAPTIVGPSTSAVTISTVTSGSLTLTTAGTDNIILTPGGSVRITTLGAGPVVSSATGVLSIGATTTAPATSIGVGIVNFYGTAATNFLGDPVAWEAVTIGATAYKRPLYT